MSTAGNRMDLGGTNPLQSASRFDTSLTGRIRQDQPDQTPAGSSGGGVGGNPFQPLIDSLQNLIPQAPDVSGALASQQQAFNAGLAQQSQQALSPVQSLADAIAKQNMQFFQQLSAYQQKQQQAAAPTATTPKATAPTGTTGGGMMMGGSSVGPASAAPSPTSPGIAAPRYLGGAPSYFASRFGA